eukprot:s9931_g2.t1
MSGTAESGETAGMQAGGGLGHLPWQQIPRFIPGTTNVDEYAKRLEFLKELWPVEHLALLGPRAALQVEGAAFQKVSRIAPDKLKGNDGVKLLVESLGGSWGRSSVEDKYYYFEQAIFQTCQKHDESNDSYIARHDAHFEELIAKGVKLEEIRAYLLLRHSQLSAEDKKRVVIEAKGKLDYDSTVKAVKLLGSKFFGELQNRGSSSGGRQTERNKVYEINFADDDQEEAEVHYAADSDDDSLVALLAEQGDEDAVYVTEFEEQIIEAVQDSSLAPVFSAYQEARQRLRDKAKARGFWPKGRGKSSKGKTGRKGSGKGGARHRTLADRIANSTCRICGLAGHWKRECPQREGNSRTEVTNFTQMAMNDNNLPEILHTLPDDACDFEMNEGQARTWSKPGHKDQPLSGAADPELGTEQIILDQFKNAEYSKPPGVTTLRQWGEIMLTDGKYKGRSHAHVFQSDIPYSVLMARKSTLSSAWALSFKNYAIARLKSAANQVPPRNTKKAWTHSEEDEEIDGWGICQSTPENTKHDKPRTQATGSTKRPSHPTSAATSSTMALELTAEQQMGIATRRALLLRELKTLERLQQPAGETESDAEA